MSFSLVFTVARGLALGFINHLGEAYRNALGLILIPFSAMTLIFSVYTLVAFVRTILSRRQED